VLSGGSFASSNDLRVHFGLGDASKIECLEIRWPSGVIEKVNLAGGDKIVMLEERKGNHQSTACADLPTKPR
jgi:hypothetical protein